MIERCIFAEDVLITRMHQTKRRTRVEAASRPLISIRTLLISSRPPPPSTMQPRTSRRGRKKKPPRRRSKPPKPRPLQKRRRAFNIRCCQLSWAAAPALLFQTRRSNHQFKTLQQRYLNYIRPAARISSTKSSNGNNVALLPVPACTNTESLLASDRATDWVGRLLSLICRGGMNKLVAIQSLQTKLDRMKYQMSPPPEVEAVSPRSITPTPTSTSSSNDAANKRSKEEARSEAAKMLNPRKIRKGEHASKIKWELITSNVGPTTLAEDAKDIRSQIITVSRRSQKRAASAIGLMLHDESNAGLKPLVLEAIGAGDKKAKLNEIIVEGLKDCIAHHTNEAGGTRTTAAETLLRYVVMATTFRARNDKSISNQSLVNALGTTWNQVSKGRALANHLVERKTIVGSYNRNVRSDFIRQKVVPSVMSFGLDDAYTRLDTKQGKVDVVNPITGETESIHRRIWRIVLKVQQWRLYLESDHYMKFRADNNDATVGYEIFSQARDEILKFVCNPLPQSCVDEKISGIEHAMAALLDLLRKKAAKEAVANYDGDGLKYNELIQVLRLAGAGQLVKACCCKEVEQPELWINKKKPCPKTIPLACTHGIDGRRKDRCQCCGVKKSLGILEALSNSAVGEEEVEVMVWADGKRQGTNKKSGKQNKQRELLPKTMTVKELVALTKKLLNVGIPHYQEICWLGIVMETDFSCLPIGTLLILTDFAAVMVLRAYQAKNSSIDGHAVNANFICIYNRRVKNVKEKKKIDGVEQVVSDEDIEIFTVDVHHFLAETLSKGKKNDHAMHNTCLDALIPFYQDIFRSLGMVLKRIIAWTDNAPHQYRCRQNFIMVASICERHPGVEIIHRLAAVDNHKGPHDSYGKDPSQCNKKLELQSPPIRSETGEKLFVNLHKHLDMSREESQWTKYEESNDYRLKNKGRFGMNLRRIWFVVETQEDYDRLSAKYPGRILICDRSFILDTKGQKAIDGTTSLHEVRSTATSVPPYGGRHAPRKWPLTISDLSCNCQHCFKDPNNNLCSFASWRRTREVSMIVEELRVGDIKADTYIGDGVAREIDGKIYHGHVAYFDEKDKLWAIQYDDGDTDYLNYVELCSEKQLYDASNEDDTGDGDDSEAA